MSSKTRMLGAGRAGSTAYGSNVNLIQFGDRLQGLAPQATHFFISGNGKAGWHQYQTRTYAPKRNFIFCMNQLGGVGAGKSQFKIGGLNEPDGAKYCAPYPYKNKNKILQDEKNTSLGFRTGYSSLSFQNSRSLWEGYCNYILQESLDTMSPYEETFYSNLAIIDELNEKETHGATFNLTSASYYDEDTITTKLSAKNNNSSKFNIHDSEDKKEMHDKDVVGNILNPKGGANNALSGLITTNIPIPSSVTPLSPITFQKSFLDNDEIQSYLSQIHSTERVQQISVLPTLIPRIVKAIYGKSYNYDGPPIETTKIRYTCEAHDSHYDVIEGIKGRPQGNSVVLYLKGSGTFSISNENNNKNFQIDSGTLISWDNFNNYHAADGPGCRILIGPLILSKTENTNLETGIQARQGTSGPFGLADGSISSYISTNNPFLATKNYQRNEFQCFSIQDLSNVPCNSQKANCKLVQFTSVLLALVAIKPISKGDTLILSHKVSLERLSVGIYNYWGPARGLQVYRNNTMENNSLLYKTQNWSGLYAPPVINQGSCGDCWAISATEQMVADAVRLKYLKVPRLYSITQARSCTTLFNNQDHGCYGGITEDVFQYAFRKYNGGSIAPNYNIKVSKGTSVDDADELPKEDFEKEGGSPREGEPLQGEIGNVIPEDDRCTETSENCLGDENEVDQGNNTSNINCKNINITNCLKVKNYYKISKDSSYQTEQAMKNHLMNTGTLSICLVASSKKWQHYESGIIGFNEDIFDKVVDHAVLAVGFSEAKKRNFPNYYIIQNSWGDKWGNKGFIKLAFGYNAFKLTSDVYYTDTIVGKGTEPKSIDADVDEDSVFYPDR